MKIDIINNFNGQIKNEFIKFKMVEKLDSDFPLELKNDRFLFVCKLGQGGQGEVCKYIDT